MSCDPAIRRWLARLHSWIGAIAAIFVAAIGLSGAAVASFGTWFRLQFGAMMVASGPAIVGPGRIITSASIARPDFRVFGLFMPHSRVDVDVALVFGLPPWGRGPGDLTMLAVDPHTARFLGAFRLNDAIGHQIVDFHSQLLGGPLGGTFVASLGVLLTLFAISGIWLWWPRSFRAAAQKLITRPRRAAPIALFFKLHSFLGVWSALLILFFAVTGVGAARPTWLGLGVRPEPSSPVLVRDCGGVVAPDDALNAAIKKFPGAVLATLEMPRPDFPAYRLTLKPESNADPVEGDVGVFASARCRGLIEVERVNRLGSRMLGLHGGRALGVLGPWIVALAGLTTALMAASGVYVWAGRTFRRRVKARDQAR